MTLRSAVASFALATLTASGCTEGETSVQPPSGEAATLGTIRIEGVITVVGLDTAKPIEPEPDPQPVEPEPTPIEPSGDAEYWNELAAIVEAGVVTDTDTLLKMVDMLAASGDIDDVSRVDVYRPRRVNITDANRAAVVSQLRGG